MTGVSTTGRHEAGQFVKQYKLIYWNMGQEIWMDVVNEHGQTHVSYGVTGVCSKLHDKLSLND